MCDTSKKTNDMYVFVKEKKNIIVSINRFSPEAQKQHQ